ncbi:MAG: immunity 49 family protein [Planctomycetes bacterium]|nr:immunity 49 family protein [Planctomycetota bacterium]
MGDLRLTRENVDFMIRVLARDVDLGRRAEDEGKQLTTLAVLHRWRGIARHLASGATSPFTADLVRAVQARRDYLKRLQAGAAAASARYASLPQNRALFDALAIGDHVSATALARLGLQLREGQPEPDVDGCLLEYLHGLLVEWPPDPAAAAGAGRTGRATSVLAGAGPGPEADLVTALEVRDGAAFSRALSALVEQRRARFAADLTLPPEAIATERHVFVLGIALVNVARAMGMTTAVEYPTVPRQLLGLQPPPVPPPESWRRPA